AASPARVWRGLFDARSPNNPLQTRAGDAAVGGGRQNRMGNRKDSRPVRAYRREIHTLGLQQAARGQSNSCRRTSNQIRSDTVTMARYAIAYFAPTAP